MPRDDGVYMADMIRACEKIQRFTQELDRQSLESDEMRLDAVLRNLEVLGEAAKGVSPSTRDAYPDIPWPKICGLRDVVIHHYFGIDLDVIWDVVSVQVPILQKRLAHL